MLNVLSAAMGDIYSRHFNRCEEASQGQHIDGQVRLLDCSGSQVSHILFLSGQFFLSLKFRIDFTSIKREQILKMPSDFEKLWKIGNFRILVFF